MEKPCLFGADYSVCVRIARPAVLEAPMFNYFLMAPEGREMIGHDPNLASWRSRIAARPSVEATDFSGLEERRA